MAAVTNNISLNPGDGWKQLTSANIASFMTISHFPHHIPIFITIGASAPTGVPSGGYRIQTKSEFFQGAITGNVYARIQNNTNGPVSVSVFAN